MAAPVSRPGDLFEDTVADVLRRDREKYAWAVRQWGQNFARDLDVQDLDALYTGLVGKTGTELLREESERHFIGDASQSPMAMGPHSYFVGQSAIASGNRDAEILRTAAPQMVEQLRQQYAQERDAALAVAKPGEKDRILRTYWAKTQPATLLQRSREALRTRLKAARADAKKAAEAGEHPLTRFERLVQQRVALDLAIRQARENHDLASQQRLAEQGLASLEVLDHIPTENLDGTQNTEALRDIQTIRKWQEIVREDPKQAPFLWESARKKLDAWSTHMRREIMRRLRAERDAAAEAEAETEAETKEARADQVRERKGRALKRKAQDIEKKIAPLEKDLELLEPDAPERPDKEQKLAELRAQLEAAWAAFDEADTMLDEEALAAPEAEAAPPAAPGIPISGEMAERLGISELPMNLPASTSASAAAPNYPAMLDEYVALGASPEAAVQQLEATGQPLDEAAKEIIADWYRQQTQKKPTP